MKAMYSLITVLVCFISQLSAQQLALEWQGVAGSAPTGNRVIITDVDDMTDFNDDGKRDLPVFNKSTMTIPVTSGANSSQKWQYLPPLGISFDMELWKVVGGFRIFTDGFESGSTSSLKAMVLAQRSGTRLSGLLDSGKVKYEGGVVVFNKSYQLVGIDDYDNDNLFELLLYDRNTKRMELWGAGN